MNEPRAARRTQTRIPSRPRFAATDARCFEVWHQRPPCVVPCNPRAHSAPSAKLHNCDCAGDVAKVERAGSACSNIPALAECTKYVIATSRTWSANAETAKLWHKRPENMCAGAGQYLSCTGLTDKGTCATCSNPVCRADQYRTGCSGTTDARCTDQPTCLDSQYVPSLARAHSGLLQCLSTCSPGRLTICAA